MVVRVRAAICPLLAGVLIIGGISSCIQRDKTPVGVTISPKPVNRAARIAVKHGTDPDASNVAMAPQTITLAELAAHRAPVGMADDVSNPEYQKHRISPFETQVWRVEANVKSVVHRKDGDYYLVLNDDLGTEAVVEVPDPKFCQGSPMAGQIQAARADIERRFHPTDTATEVNQKAAIDGVGFFGFKGKQGGTGARLMPGLGFKWK